MNNIGSSVPAKFRSKLDDNDNLNARITANNACENSSDDQEDTTTRSYVFLQKVWPTLSVKNTQPSGLPFSREENTGRITDRPPITVNINNTNTDVSKHTQHRISNTE